MDSHQHKGLNFSHLHVGSDFETSAVMHSSAPAEDLDLEQIKPALNHRCIMGHDTYIVQLQLSDLERADQVSLATIHT
jgi:hypothetical protein